MRIVCNLIDWRACVGRLRKVKMDQRKLMDNANTITDMAKTQNTVYEIVSDMSTRQDALEERIQSLEDKIQSVQVTFTAIEAFVSDK